MSTSIKENISKNIAKYRKEKGLSQNALAEMVGAKNFTTVSSWERGISSPDADTVIKLCEILDITLYDLYEVKSDFETFSPLQKNLLQKYESLDPHGREVVDFVLEKEYDRSIKEYKKSETPLHLMPVAAHNDNLDNEQQQLMRNDLDRLNKL